MSKTLRDKIRARTVGAKNQFKSELVDYFDVQIEVRQVDISSRSEYINSAIDKNRNANTLKLQINAVIASCFVPGTDEKVFEDTDYDVISESISGGYCDKLYETVQNLSNLTLEDAKKN